MVGFHAIGDPEQPFSFNDGEIAEADWFTRGRDPRGARSGDWSAAGGDVTFEAAAAPDRSPIAREIIESWAALD